MTLQRSASIVRQQEVTPKGPRPLAGIGVTPSDRMYHRTPDQPKTALSTTPSVVKRSESKTSPVEPVGVASELSTQQA